MPTTLPSRYDIEVVNIRLGGKSEYIGRPSALGNPYPISQHHTRDYVCDEYEAWFQLQIHLNEPLVLAELKRLHRVGKRQGKLRLGCYCKPKYRCHGDTIKRWLEENYEYLEMIL